MLLKLKYSMKRSLKNVIFSLLFGYLVVSYGYIRIGQLYSSLDSVESLEKYLGNLSTIADDDPSFIKYIQRKLLPPAPQHVPLKIYGDIKTGQIGQAEEIIKYFNGKKNGVFVEAGAWNGEYLSNTLYLEVWNNVYQTFF